MSLNFIGSLSIYIIENFQRNILFDFDLWVWIDDNFNLKRWRVFFFYLFGGSSADFGDSTVMVCWNVRGDDVQIVAVDA